ncbi:GNAT family N-acetyltransferase [bacterium]|nr:GNAT family N-acetyltransferase [bacterium]
MGKWDKYVESHPDSNLYHLSGWKNVIEKTYGHETYYLIATTTQFSVIGILPLVHMKHFIFGNRLVSIPFFDMGGMLAESEDSAALLLAKAVKIGKEVNASSIELRHARPIPWFGKEARNALNEPNEHNGSDQLSQQTLAREITDRNERSGIQCTNLTNSTNKALMILDLPDSSEELMKSFKSKLRSQIKRPLKEGLYVKTGGLDLVDDFYSVFCVNMRDLGSPVHSKALIQNVIEEYPDQARLVMVYKGQTPVACSMVVGHRDTLKNPWASSLRDYSTLSPNMLLYWTMLEYACDNGYRKFDFGRSTPGEGTYKFKKQWGAEAQPLHWQTVALNGIAPADGRQNEKSKFEKAIQYWQKLPVSVTKMFGPMIRKHISL